MTNRKTENLEKLLITTLSGIKEPSTPIWLMRQAGRYLPEYRKLRVNTKSFLDLCYSPDMATTITLQPIRRFNLDAAIVFSDILVIPDALGQEVKFVEGEGPRLGPMNEDRGHLSLDKQKFLSHLSPVYETIQKISSSDIGKTAIIGFAGAPWTIATYMIEGGPTKTFSKVKGWSYRDPDSFERLINGLVVAITWHLEQQIQAGAEVIQIFDSWAGVLSPKSFHRWVIKPTRQIVQNIKNSYSHIPIIGFPRGAGIGYVDYVNETKVNAVSLDTTVPTRWAAENIPKDCVLQGNLDPDALLNGGIPMLEHIRTILRDFSERNHVFNLGHGVLPTTPINNVETLIKTVKSYNSSN